MNKQLKPCNMAMINDIILMPMRSINCPAYDSKAADVRVPQRYKIDNVEKDIPSFSIILLFVTPMHTDCPGADIMQHNVPNTRITYP